MNVGCSGDVDLVLRIDGAMYPIDVKASVWDKEGHWRAANNSKVSEGVWALNVDPNDAGYLIRWPNMHGVKRNAKTKRYTCPPGLEEFWD